MNKLLTIIVPVYNVSTYLEKCIDSILSQTYKEIEVILVNDGSSDLSGQICDEYAAKDNRIIVIHKENGGLVSARKAGIQVAKGYYVGYVDGDDWINEDMYERLIHDMEKSGADIVESDHYINVGNYEKVMHSKLEYGCFRTEEIIPIMLCDDDFNECRLIPYLCLKLFKREILKEIQLKVDERIGCGEDIAVTYPYMIKAKTIFISDYVGYHYVQRIGSMTNLCGEDELKKDRALISHLKKAFEESSFKECLLRQLNQYAKSMLLLRQISFFDDNKHESILSPYGGILPNSKLILYGAGKVGQCIFKYINSIKLGEIVCWLDQEYIRYQEMGLDVKSPQVIAEFKDKCDSIIIAVSSKKLAKSIEKYLLELGADKNKILWLTDEFVSDKYDVLAEVL